MALGAVTELEVFTAVKAKLAGVGGWFATEQVKFHFGRRPPNAAPPPYVVIAVEEQDADDFESDGAVAQKFMAEIAVRAVGPEDAEAAMLLLVQCEPRWYLSDHGVDLADTDKCVVPGGVMPKTGKLRLIEPLLAGEDQYTLSRRWEIHTAALIGG